MSFVSAFWLLLLHALSGATALPNRDTVRASAPAAQVDAVLAELGARIAAIPSRVPEESIRAPHGPANTVLARVDRAVSHGGIGELPVDRQPAQLHSAGATRRVLRHAGHATHRLASLGSHLPYYPTAPPALS